VFRDVLPRRRLRIRYFRSKSPWPTYTFPVYLKSLDELEVSASYYVPFIPSVVKYFTVVRNNLEDRTETYSCMCHGAHQLADHPRHHPGIVLILNFQGRLPSVDKIKMFADVHSRCNGKMALSNFNAQVA